MNCTYNMREDIIKDEDGNPHTVYGIEARQNGKLLRAVPDVFFDEEKAQSFIDLCNKEDLSLIHLDDVIEDIL